MLSFKNQKAQSILEVIVAMAIFSLIAAAIVSLSVGGFTAVIQGGEHTQAQALAQEGIEAVRSIRDRSFNELIYSPATVSISGNQWILNNQASEFINDKYARTITFIDVCRDLSDNITVCPGFYTDVNTKQVTVVVMWNIREGVTNSVQKITYLTNWDYKEWIQTDWSGGNGQGIWSNETRYDFDNGDIDYSVAGEIKLSFAADGSWVYIGGTESRDTTDTDFTQEGTSFINTVVNGTGNSANVVLDYFDGWEEHGDSRSATTQDLQSVFAVSTSDVWAVGKSGKIIHYDGSNWSEFTDLGSKDLRAIYMVSSSDGWIVSHSGEIYHYNGTEWTEFVDIGGTKWHDIDMVSSSDGWAIEHNGNIYYYDEDNWTEVLSLDSDDLNSIYMISSSDGWTIDKDGKIFQYNGSEWSEAISPTSNELESIYMGSSFDGWAVGKDGQIIHYNGSAWSLVSSPTSKNLISVYMVSSSDGWAVGKDGAIIHYDGSSWSEAPSPTGIDLKSVYMISSSDGWVVGKNGIILEPAISYSNSGTFESRIFDSEDANTMWDEVYWTETLPSESDLTIATRTGNTASPDETWSSFSAELSDPISSSVTSPDGRYLQYRATFTRGSSVSETPELADITIVYNSLTSQHLRDIDFVSASDVWAVGNSGKIFHYDGNSWSEFDDMGGDNINTIDIISASDIWAAGDSGTIYHYNGVVWSSVSSPTDKDLNSIYMLSSSDGWAVGKDGAIIHYDGNSWSEFDDMGGDDINSIYMLSSSDGWATGDKGKIFHYDGNSWSEFDDTGSQNWSSIFMVSTSDGWLAGDSGRIWHYDGSSWTESIDTGNTYWRDIYMFASDDGWVVGYDGDIYRWLDSEWTEFSSPTTKHIKSIKMISDSEGWAIGNGGTIIQFTKEGLYTAGGYFISSAFDMGYTFSAQSIEWDDIIPTCSPACEIKLQIRVASDDSGSPGIWTGWYGEAGLDSYFTNKNGTIITSDLNDNQWIQYRVEFIGDTLDTAILQETRIIY